MEAPRIYIAAPLFNDSERERNVQLRTHVQALGFRTYLPQEDAGIATALIEKGSDVYETRKALFQMDVEAVRASDIVLCVLDGRVPDEGMCVELGMAFALGKKCIGFMTDQRSFDRHGHNLMIEGCLVATAHTLSDLSSILSPYGKNTH